jgi:GNAT superfamily N-acetyltransferase
MVRVLEGADTDDRGDYLVVRSPHNPTFWWGNFLLLASPPNAADAADWLDRHAAEFPAARHIALGIDVTEVGAVDVEGLTAHGLRLERSEVLTTQSVHEPPQPQPNAIYRELSGDEDWRQAAELRDAVTSGEPGNDAAFLKARLRAERSLTDDGYGAWHGAFVDGQLVAQLGVISDGSGLARYQNVETHPEWRRQGLAGTLVWQAGLHALEHLGATTLVMVADPDYTAIRVYRSVGFIDTETQIGFERQPQ